MIKSPLPLLGFAAYSGTGKTTLLCKLIPLLKAKGIRIGVVKHAHHDFDIDYPGKDSYELRKSGASNIVVASRKRTAIIIEHDDEQEEPTLEDVLKYTNTQGLDLILVEGFKRANLPKIELHRKALDKPYLYPNDSNIIAIALDHSLDAPNLNNPDNSYNNDTDHKNNHIPVQLDLNKPSDIVDFIMKNILENMEEA